MYWLSLSVDCSCRRERQRLATRSTRPLVERDDHQFAERTWIPDLTTTHEIVMAQQNISLNESVNSTIDLVRSSIDVLLLHWNDAYTNSFVYKPAALIHQPHFCERVYRGWLARSGNTSSITMGTTSFHPTSRWYWLLLFRLGHAHQWLMTAMPLWLWLRNEYTASKLFVVLTIHSSNSCASSAVFIFLETIRPLVYGRDLNLTMTVLLRLLLPSEMIMNMVHRSVHAPLFRFRKDWFSHGRTFCSPIHLCRPNESPDQNSLRLLYTRPDTFVPGCIYRFSRHIWRRLPYRSCSGLPVPTFARIES